MGTRLRDYSNKRKYFFKKAKVDVNNSSAWSPDANRHLCIIIIILLSVYYYYVENVNKMSLPFPPIFPFVIVAP